MKKLFIFTMIFLGSFMLCYSVEAYDDYQSFNTIEMASGKLLEDWTDLEYKNYLAPTRRRIPFGWKINYVNKNVKATYTSEILFSYYNDGTTPIVQELKKKENYSNKRVTSVKGSLGVTGKASDKKLSGGLESKIEGSLTDTSEYDSISEMEMKFSVDPQTKVVVKIEGTAKVTNGTATKYSAFVRCYSGAFEVFIITSQYLRIEKTRIR